MQYLKMWRDLFEQVQIGPVIPCSQQEVRDWEEEIGQSLPMAYREFLLWMGNDSGRFLRGSYCLYRHRERLRLGTPGLMERYDFKRSLPSDAFVFWAHQGYQFLFFRLSDGQDPPINWFNGPETKSDFAWNTYPSFSKFLGREIIGHAQLMEQISGQKNGIREWVATDCPVHPREYDAEIQGIRHLRSKLEAEQASLVSRKPYKFSAYCLDPICIACEAEIFRLHRDFPNDEFKFIQKSSQL